ncbi:MAG TPA: NADH-quinone oxidoreductase subunit NuoG [candidate division Zixibacteria bacterium]|nr:NADH-quinone oxidoreductase subunit NuoG [candidate division Zixibacteria bacterium]
MVTIYIDDKSYEVEKGQNLLQAVLSLGLNLPYFCWHPALGSVGACRQCAVIQYRDEDDKEGNLIMACMQPVQDGMRISIEAAAARKFRASIIEWLMVNHPHDCPVCDEGGECHLQDMTVMTGHNYRKFRFKKRTHRNQYLGPFINHEMNRCIACYRCVRFYRDYAGGKDLQDMASHDYVYFGRSEEGILQSEFSGNLVEVCPTGVFTDKTLKKHYTRKWDLQSAPSVCHHCSLGCNTLVGERYNKAVRILNRYNRRVNGYFMCDRGRFGYEFTNSNKRIRKPIFEGKVEDFDRDSAAAKTSELLKDRSKVIGIGSPRASLEANFALKSMVGEHNFYSGLSARENKLARKILSILRNGPARPASLHDVETADAVFVLGEDLTNTAPMLDLAVKQAIRNKPIDDIQQIHIDRWNDAAIREYLQDEKGPFYLATPSWTKLDEFAAKTYRAAPDDIARLGYAVAHALDESSPAVEGLPDEIKTMAEEIAGALKNARQPVLISGMSMRSEAVIEAAANVARALCRDDRKADIVYTLPECNSMGTAFLGGYDLEKAFEDVENGTADTVIILESDLYRHADKTQVDKFLEKCANLIVVDYLKNRTSEGASAILPAAAFAEGDGTLINNEGRVQRFFQALNPDPILQESWRWIRDIMIKLDDKKAEKWKALDDISDAVLNSLEGINPKIEIAPSANFRINEQKIPRAPMRYSGRTAMYADKSVHEPKPPDDPDSPLSFSMEGFAGPRPSSLISFFWAPGWNSVQSVARYQQEVAGELKGGDPGVRLIEPGDHAKPEYFKTIPDAFKPRQDEFYFVPLYHIFGSEELSNEAEAVSELVPDAYLALNKRSAEKTGVSSRDKVKVSIKDGQISLPVKIMNSLPDNIAGIPVGLPGMNYFELPAFGKIAK